MSGLAEWLNSINHKKNDIRIDNPDIKYDAFIINKCLSGSIDTLFPANEMNINHHLDWDMQYDYLLNSVTKKKRFAKWVRQEEDPRLKVVKEYYGYSSKRAREVLDLISDEDYKTILDDMYTGGTV